MTIFINSLVIVVPMCIVYTLVIVFGNKLLRKSISNKFLRILLLVLAGWIIGTMAKNVFYFLYTLISYGDGQFLSFDISVYLPIIGEIIEVIDFYIHQGPFLSGWAQFMGVGLYYSLALEIVGIIIHIAVPVIMLTIKDKKPVMTDIYGMPVNKNTVVFASDLNKTAIPSSLVEETQPVEETIVEENADTISDAEIVEQTEEVCENMISEEVVDQETEVKPVIEEVSEKPIELTIEPTKKFCPYCGAKLVIGGVFCPKCGAKID